MVVENLLYNKFFCCFSTKWVKVNGIEYKCGVGVILDVENDLPQVGYVQDIYIVNCNQIAIHVKIFSSTYEVHYQAYLLHEEEGMTKLVYLNKLFLQTPVHIRTSHVLGTNQYIILPHSLCTL